MVLFATHVKGVRLLISVEGPSCAGKSTLISSLICTKEADKFFYSALTSKMKSDDCLDKRLRQFIQQTNVSIDPLEEALLFASRLANKARMAQSCITDPKQVILADRYHTSLIVLAHYIRGLPKDKVLSLVDFSMRGVKPSGVIFLDINYSTYLQRGGDLHETRSAKEGECYFNKSRQGYIQEMRNETIPILFLETSCKPIECCFHEVSLFIKTLLIK